MHAWHWVGIWYECGFWDAGSPHKIEGFILSREQYDDTGPFYWAILNTPAFNCLLQYLQCTYNDVRTAQWSCSRIGRVLLLGRFYGVQPCPRRSLYKSVCLDKIYIKSFFYCFAHYKRGVKSRLPILRGLGFGFEAAIMTVLLFIEQNLIRSWRAVIAETPKWKV